MKGDQLSSYRPAARAVLAAAALFLAGTAGTGAAPAAYEVPAAPHTPEIDIGLTDAAWRPALAASSFTDYQTKSAAPAGTQAYLTADDRDIYVAFSCEQAGPVNASGNVNDLRAQSVDYVEFDVDPSGNGARIYRFLATPNQLQAQYSSESTRYYPKWTARGTVESGRYVVEMIIPFKAMKLDRGGLRSARVNFTRHVAAAGADYTSAYDSRMTDLHSDSRYWVVARGLRPSASILRGDPTGDVYVLDTAGSDRNHFTSPIGGLSVRNPRLAGVDVTYPFTSTISLVATAAPDFSNVDVDQTTIAPQRFPFRYTEYRPFFARGQQYVDPLPFRGVAQTNVDLFYTPTLGFLDTGIKVEGTAGSSAFGVLTAKGQGFNDVAMGYQLASRDRSQQLAVQAVAANHEGVADRSAGVSYLFQSPKSGVFVNAEHLVDRNPFVTTPSAANASLLAAGIHSARWLGEVGFESVGPEFAPLDGYVSNGDIRGPFAYLGYSQPLHGLRQFSLTGSVDRFAGWNGASAESDASLALFLQTNSLVSLSVGASTSELATYATGFPDYRGRDDVLFDQTSIDLGFGGGTSRSIDVSYAFGPFAIPCFGRNQPRVCADRGPSGYARAFLQQPGLVFARQLGPKYTLSFQYAGSIERSATRAVSDSQWLRRIAVSRAIGKRGSLGLSLRSINGRGGYATPGVNLSGLLDLQLANLDHLYAEFGSPSSTRTLNRVLVKYVFHVGGGVGI